MHSAEIYQNTIDWEKRFQKEIPFFQRLFASKIISNQDQTLSLRALDLGCGPGIHLAKLLEILPQWEISGCDLSADMISLAEDATKKFSNRGNLIAADLQEINPKQFPQFHLIYCVGNSLLLMMEKIHPEKVFSIIYELCRPGGLFFFQILNNGKPRQGYVASKIIETQSGDFFHTLKRFSPDLEKNWMDVEFVEFFQENSQNTKKLDVRNSGWPLITLNDINTIFQQQGTFKILKSWSNYAENPFSHENSDALLVLCQKCK